MTMTRRQRLLATINGEATDRPAAALWRHFPRQDTTAAGLANAVVKFQRDHGFDLVKVTPTSGYPAEAWGGELEDDNNEEGTRRYTRRVVTSSSDWDSVKPLDPKSPVWLRELEALRLVRDGVGPDVHVFQTVFSPLTIAKQMVGATVLDEMRAHPEAVGRALAAISQTSARFTSDCLSNGADGIFFATQFARRDRMSDDEYDSFGVPYDMPIVEAIKGGGALLLLHLCGDDVMFERAAQYGADIVNWHARTTQPSLADGHASFGSGAVLGGIDRRGALLNGTPDDVAVAVREALADTGGTRTIVGAGCVTLVDTPPANIRAVHDSVAAS